MPEWLIQDTNFTSNLNHKPEKAARQGGFFISSKEKHHPRFFQYFNRKTIFASKMIQI